MRVLYVVYWGLREPLGRSLVLPAVRALAREGIDIDLISFEKPSDWGATATIAALRAELLGEGVRWHPLLYHKRPNIPATLYDVMSSALLALRLPRPDLIHGRTFIGGLIATIVAALLRRPLVFHGEGFWPDQQIEGGFWPKNGLVYRLTKALETWMYGRADGLVLLSRTSQSVVEAIATVRDRHAPLAVVPSCVDANRFRPSSGRRTPATAPIRLVYAGSLGGRYLIEPLGRFLSAIRDLAPSAELLVLSHSNHDEIRARISATGIPREAWSLLHVDHEEVPAYLSEANAGLFFLQRGIGALSCSPTKVGEYWACGLPVVMNAGVGDLDSVVRTRRVGVLLSEFDRGACRSAAEQLIALLNEEDLSRRCRDAAIHCYDVQRGVADQVSLYGAVLERVKKGQHATEPQ